MSEINDAQVLGSLLTEETLQGYQIKPWTVKQLLQVTPILKEIAAKLQEMGVTVERFADLVTEHGIAGVAGLVDIILPHLPRFLAVSFRMTEDETGELDLALALALAVRVLIANIEHLKNSFSLIMGQISPLVRREDATH